MDTSTSTDSGSVNVPNWVLVVGFALFAAIAGWVLYTMGNRGSEEKALLEAALRQYQEQAQSEQANSPAQPPPVTPPTASTKVAMGVYAPDRPVAPPSAPGPGRVPPANPFAGGNGITMPSALEGDLPVLPQPEAGSRSANSSEPSPAPPVDDRAELFVYLVTTLNPTEDRQALVEAALAAGGFAQNFTDFFGDERIVQADAIVLYVPRSRVESVNADVRKLGGRLEDQWRGAQRDRQAELEGPQRRLLQKLLAERSALLKDFEEDAPVIQELDVMVDRVRDSFRSLRPTRDTRGLAAFRITLVDAGG